MGNSFSIGEVALETLFGLVAVFLFFAPKVFSWSAWSYLGGIIFLVLTFVVLIIKHR
jgi:hypothetical protein